jgi:D-sedoheptulose 7-phosphate isomerase
MIDSIRRSVAESLELKQRFFAGNEDRIAAAAESICLALEGGRKVLLYGNGGSAADAQHIAAELVGRFRDERRPLAAMALTTDTSVLTSVGNDYGYDEIFRRQVRALGCPGDVAIAISTSGRSRNVILATMEARAIGLLTAALTGSDGGALGGLVTHHLNVPHASTARVQEVHIMIGHLLCELIEKRLKGL